MEADQGQRELDKLLAAAHHFYQGSAAMQAFAPWPDDLQPAGLLPRDIPATAIIAGWQDDDSLHKAVQAASPHIHWSHGYTEAEVGRDFLDGFGYLELYGPYGLFHSAKGRGFISFWRRGLDYPWHYHKAEELYAIVSGTARFEAHGDSPEILRAGDTKFHHSNQHHAMQTPDDHVLTFVLWRGNAITEFSKIVT